MKHPANSRPLLVLASFAAIFACDTMAHSEPPSLSSPPSVAAPAAAPAAPEVPTLQMPDFAALAAQVLPAVVSIQVEQRVRAPAHGPHSDPFGFFDFYGQAPPREFANKGIGSGFIIDANGLILTNQHVIDKADSIVVRLSQPDGSEQRLVARVVGTAPDYDVALLRTDGLAAVATRSMTLGDSAATRIGDWVMAVGNPFGLDHSVSVGIISAKDRRDVAPSGRQGLYDFLQTDASINPGNSGGPLINLRGEVIGINAAINAQGQGIGFAIPINMVKAMLPQLKTHGTFTRSFLGVRVQMLSDELSQSFHYDKHYGVLVAEVVDGSPAQAAGVRAGDIVLAFGDKRLNRASDLQLFASMAGAGKQVTLQLWRQGDIKQVTVTLAPLSTPPKEAPPPGDSEMSIDPGAAAHIGLTVADVPPELRGQLGVAARGATIVQRVLPGGVAEQAGLQRLDVIESVDDVPVRDARSFVERVEQARSNEVLRLRVLRQGSRHFATLRRP